MKIIVNLIKAILLTAFGLAILFFLDPGWAFSDEVFASYGLGVFNSAKNVASETKVSTIGYRAEIYQTAWSIQGKAGFFMDGSGDPKRSSSAYGSIGPSYTVRAGLFEIRNSIGLGFITNTDSYLGGHFPQFNPEIYIGIRDKNGSGIGLQYEHISSAGIFQPNIGRDFCLIQLSQRF